MSQVQNADVNGLIDLSTFGTHWSVCFSEYERKFKVKDTDTCTLLSNKLLSYGFKLSFKFPCSHLCF